MSRQTEKIPIPGRLDEVIDESLDILKKEKRKQRVRMFAGIAAGMIICAGCFGATEGIFLPGADKPERTAQRILPEDSEADVKLAKEDPAGGKRPRRENFLYMQESGGITVTAANVYYNGYTLYMTVTVRSEEPFADSFGAETTGDMCRIGMESEGAADQSIEFALPDYIEGRFLDDRTFLGTVRAPLAGDESSAGGKAADDFYYDWSIRSFCGEDGGDETKYVGDWDFHVAVPADMRDTEVTEINGADASGEGIACVVKTAEDISARLILPEGTSENAYVTVMCDASGAPLNRSGDYFRTENRDISTVYVFLCGREDYEKIAEEYQAADRKNGVQEWIQSLRECALYSEKVHFESEYLSVVQAAWGGR